jgi:hypothetical protein
MPVGADQRIRPPFFKDRTTAERAETPFRPYKKQASAASENGRNTTQRQKISDDKKLFSCFLCLYEKNVYLCSILFVIPKANMNSNRYRPHP